VRRERSCKRAIPRRCERAAGLIGALFLAPRFIARGVERPVVLFTDMVQRSPANALGYNQLAGAYLELGRGKMPSRP